MSNWNLNVKKTARKQKSKEKRRLERLGGLNFEALEPRKMLVNSIPFVDDILVSSTSWTDSFRGQLEVEGLGGEQGYALEAGSTNTLPWRNLNQVTLDFDRDLDVQANDLLAQNVNLGVDTALLAGTFDYDATTFTATWTFDTPLDTDRYAFRINEEIFGDAITSSDDGVLAFDIVSGDGNRSDTTNVLDGVEIRNRLFSSTLNPENYSVFFDTDGSGSINVLDGLNVRRTLFDTLPDDTLDLEGPVINASLANDTGADDGITSDSIISGTITDQLEIIQLEAMLDGGAPALIDIQADGTFEFDPQLATDGTADGPHSVIFSAVDAFGNSSEQVSNFIFDSVGPELLNSGVVQVTPSTINVGFSEVIDTDRFDTSSISVVITSGANAGESVLIESVDFGAGDEINIRFVEELSINSYRLEIGEGVFDLAGIETQFEGIEFEVADPADQFVINLGETGNGGLFEASFTEDQGAVNVVSADATVDLPAGITLASLTVAISNLLDGNAESLAANVTGTSISQSFDAATGVLQLTGTDSAANYQQVLRSIQYNNTSQAPNETDRSIQFSFSDGSNSVTANTVVSVSNVNDGPNLTLPAPFDDSTQPFLASLNQEIPFNVSVVDPDDSEVTYSLDLDNSGIPATAAQPTISPTGAFSWTPNEEGTFTIGIIALDPNGASDVEFLTIQVGETIPAFAGIASILPTNGDQLVAADRVVTLNFDAPVDPTSVTAESFFASVNGESLPGDIIVSSTGMFARLSFDESLPGSTQVSLFVDGNLITDSAGVPIDANGNEEAGGIFTTTFTTVPEVSVEGTSLSGRVVASEPDVNGNDVPLGGVTIRVEGMPQFQTVTNENGEFTLADVPAPTLFVTIDGSTTSSVGGSSPTGEGFYPSIGELFETVPGEAVNLAHTIFLPFVTNDAIQEIVPGEELTIGLPAGQVANDPELQEVRLTIPADGLRLSDGSLATEVGIFQVASDRLPAPLPGNLSHAFDVTIQAEEGAFFDSPAPISFPNSEGLSLIHI